jgi:crotonobetainyl-CoA:carnitine CoA-transferase CaiB-like acyl-CoA transferase
MQGVTSHAHAVGEGSEPRLFGAALADKVTGTMAAQAVLAGLLARERGQGAGRVDISMLDACAYFAAPDMLETRMVVSEAYTEPPKLAFPSTLVRCADGHAVVCPGSGAQIAAACRAVGHPEWVELLRAQPSHAALGRELNRLLGTAAATMTTESLLKTLTAHDVPCAPALDLDGQLTHPQVLHNGTYPEYVDQHFGTVRRARYPAVGAQWSSPETSRSSPGLGQHTAEATPADDGPEPGGAPAS